MHVITRLIALPAAFLMALPAARAEPAPQVAVRDAWVRATVPAQQATGAFMQLRAARDGKLVAASSPAARVVEVHEMAMQADIMRMRRIPFLPLPANRPVDLKPGGYHLMLIDLKRQAKEGDTIPLALVVEDADGRRETVRVDAAVRGLAAGEQRR